MIASYCDYIGTYVRKGERTTSPVPGEHHFVATYLVPKLFAITGTIPDYVNPDGTKAILGDVVYYRDGRHHFGIEVKLGTIRLTKKEYNEWIIGAEKTRWPNLYIGIASDGLCLATWEIFRNAYLSAIRRRTQGWLPIEISDGYGPTISVNTLSKAMPPAYHFRWSSDRKELTTLEEHFTIALTNEVGAISTFS